MVSIFSSGYSGLERTGTAFWLQLFFEISVPAVKVEFHLRIIAFRLRIIAFRLVPSLIIVVIIGIWLGNMV